MPTADTARMVASLTLEDKFTQSAQRIEQSVDKLSGSMSHLQKASFVTQAAATATGVAIERVAAKGLSLLVEGVQGGVEALTQLEQVQNQTTATLQSVGRVAGLSATQIGDLSQSLEDLTTVDNKVVQAGANVLLRYTDIGKTVFPNALKAANALAIGLAGGNAALADVSGAATLLGKALSDPTKGISALRKANIVFTDSEVEQIKAMQKAGDVLGAQGAIIAAVTKRYGDGSQAAKGFGADQRRLQDAVEDAQIALARGLLPSLEKISTFLREKLTSPQALKFFQQLGVNVGKALEAGLAFAQRIPWDSIANALGIAAKAADKILTLFTSLPPWVQTAVITGWGLNKLTGGALTGIIKAGTGSVAGGVADVIKDAIGGIAKGAGGSVLGAVGERFFSRGSPGNPMFVLDAGGDLANIAKSTSGLPGLTTLLSGIPGLIATLAPLVALVGLPVAIVGLAEAIAGGHENIVKQDIAGRQDTARARGIPGEVPRERPQSGAISPEALDRIRGAVEKGAAEGNRPALASLENAIGDTRSETALIGHAIDDSIQAGFGRTIVALNKLDGDFKIQLGILRTSNDPDKIAAAAKAIAQDILKGAGSSKSTADVIATLKTQRAAAVKSGDTQLVRIIDSSIKQISPKLANREWVDKQFAILNDIKKDGKITSQESARLKKIQSDLLAHGDRHAAGLIAAQNHVGAVVRSGDATLGGKVDGVKAAQQAAALAARQTTEAIKDKDLSVAVTVPVTSITTIRGIGIQQRIYSKYRATAD